MRRRRTPKAKEIEAFRKRRKEEKYQDKLRAKRKGTAIKIKRTFLEEYQALCRKHGCCVTGNLVSIKRFLNKQSMEDNISEYYLNPNSVYGMSWGGSSNEYKW